MPTIIDMTSQGTRAINQTQQGLEQSMGLLLPLLDRFQRQEEEKNRMGLAEQDRLFRQQQADLGQQNTERVFGQRQQIIDREWGQEDAAAEFYRGKLQELNPGPVGAEQFAGMDARTLQGVYQTEMYAKQFTEAQTRAMAAAKGVVEDYGLAASNPMMVEQLGAMIQGAATIEDLNRARETVWKIAEETEKVRADAVLREQTVASLEPMRMALAQRPGELARANVAAKQYLAGEIDVRQYMGMLTDAVEASQGVSSERPTVDRIAYGKGLDSIATRLGSGEMTAAEAAAARGELARTFGIDGVQAASSPAPGGAAAPDVLTRLKVKPAQIDSARQAVARQPAEVRQNVAVSQALKITGNPDNLTDEEIAAVAAFLLGEG
jgi:hypothetical protein